jgi:glycolate oxidase
MKAVLETSGATDIRVSQSEAERLRFWAGRKAAFPAAGASRPTTTAWTAPFRASAWAKC